MKRSWRFYRLTHTSVGYFVRVGNCLQFWPLNAPEEQTDISKTAGTGSATYTAFRDAHGLKALPQHTLIPSFALPMADFILLSFSKYILIQMIKGVSSAAGLCDSRLISMKAKEHRGTVAGGGTPTILPEKRSPCPTSSQRAWARCDTHHHQSMGEAVQRLLRWWSGRASLGLYKASYGILRGGITGRKRRG